MRDTEFFKYRIQCLFFSLVAGLYIGSTVAADDCTDLGEFPEQLNIDFQTDVQPVFDAQCTGCHGSGATAGLDLRPGESYANLVKVPSSQDVDWLRVSPDMLSESLLFLKVNCNLPPVGMRMPPSGSMPEENQAILRDWITQGATFNSDSIYRDRFED